MLVHFMVIWNILWPFGNVVVIGYTYFPSFWYIVSRKIWQPWVLVTVTKAFTYVQFLQ
jgi:hypothetical protein